MYKVITLTIFVSGFCLCCALEKEITVNIDPGKEDCFFQSVKPGQIIDIEYQVIDGGHGDLDITFHLVDPNGRILVADYKKSENNHRADANLEGDYKFCFDNTFSSFNVKTVFFELIIESENDNEWDSQVNPIKSEDVYDIAVQDVQDTVKNVRNYLMKIRHMQELLKSTEARDRNIAEENFFKVNYYSFFQIIVMIFVSFIQVIMVRSLFDDSSKVHKIFKKLNSKY